MTVLKGSVGFLLLALLSCSHAPDPHTLVMIIESSPTTRPARRVDAQSERIGELLFDALLTRDDHLNVQPGLADRWKGRTRLRMFFIYIAE
jgi:peptide/nickel transport system substrate-binding protein